MTSMSQDNISSAYCPFDLKTDPADFGLLEGRFQDPSFGCIRYVYSDADFFGTARILLHGVGGSWTSWSAVLQAVQQLDIDMGPTILIDLPGFGGSGRDSSSLDMRSIGDLIVALASKHGCTTINLVGHSMGGFLALDMAARHLKEIASVSIISGAYFSIIDTHKNPIRALRKHPKSALAYLQLRLLASFGPVGPAAARLAWRLGILPAFLRSSVAYPKQLKPGILRSMARSVNPRSFLLAAKNGNDYEAVVQWAKIDVPITGIFGAHDTLVPSEDMESLRRIRPESKLTCLPDAGHFSHVEQPVSVARLFFGAGAELGDD